jgi:hypothetical protein
MAVNIPRLVEKNGRYHWQPSKSLRSMGWEPLKLGSDRTRAIEMAEAENRKVDQWKLTGTAPAATIERRPERPSAAYAIRRYRAEDLATKAASTRKTYSSYLGQLEHWMDDGRMPLHLVDAKRCTVLKDALIRPPELGAFEVNGRLLRAAGVDDDRTALWLAHHAGPDAAIALLTAPPLAHAHEVAPGILAKKALAPIHRERIYRVRVLAGREARAKLHRANGLLSVLSSFMKFAKEKELIAVNPMAEISVPEAPPRQQTIPAIAREAIGAIALEKGWRGIRLGIDLGVAIMQREGDMLKLDTSRYRELLDHEVPPEARPHLVGPDGRVMGVKIQQRKTKAWIGVPVVGELRERVEAAIAASRARDVAILNPPIIVDDDSGETYPEWKFQRRFRECVAAAAERAAEAGDIDLANALADIEYRDLRRTGMVEHFELGIPDHFIAAVSGHNLERTKKILEVYGPRNTRMASSGVAMAVTQLKVRADAKRDQEKQA